MISLSNDYKNAIEDLKPTVEYKTEEISFNIAVQVYERLKELKINQKDLALKLGVSKVYISQILNGKNNLTIESIVKLGDAIDLQARYDF